MMVMTFVGSPYCLRIFHPQCWSVNAVECLAEIDEIHDKRALTPCHFFQYLSQGEDLVNA